MAGETILHFGNRWLQMQVRQGFGATNSERRYGMFSAPVSLILFLGFLICPPSLAQEVELKKPSIPTDKIEAEAAKKPAEIYEQDMAQAYKAFDEEDYPLAKQRYEAILKKYPDDTRAIIGLARTLHRIKRISGVEPSELRAVMEKVKKTVDKFEKNNDEFRKAVEESLNESAEMQKKKEALAKKLRTGGAVSMRRGELAATQDNLLMQRSARQRIAEYYCKREDTRVQQRSGEALLFRRECLEPMYRNWFFLDPPS